MAARTVNEIINNFKNFIYQISISTKNTAF